MDVADIKEQITELSGQAAIAAAAVVCNRLIVLQARQSESSVDMSAALKSATLSEDGASGVTAATIERQVSPIARKTLSALAENPETRDIVVTAIAVARQSVEPMGWGGEVSKIILGAALAISLPLLIAKIGITIDAPGVHVSIAEGVPDGLVEVLDKLKEIIDAAVDPQRRTLASPPAPAPIRELRSSALSREEAIAARNELWVSSNSTFPPPYLDDPERCLKAPKPASSSSWPHSFAYRVDVGLYPQHQGPNTAAGAEPRFRLAVRLQAPRAIRKKKLQDIEVFFKESWSKLVSVREIGEVQLFGERPKKGGRWHGPTDLRIGSQMSAADSIAGCVTMFVKKPDDCNKIYALGAGHVLSNFGRLPLDTQLYHPASNDTPNPRHALGTLYDNRLFNLNAFDLLAGIEGLPSERSIDAGLVLLHTHRVATDYDLRQILGIGLLSGVRAIPMLEHGSLPKLQKVAGATSRREGWVTAVDSIVQMTLDDYSVVVGVGLTEVVGVEKPFARFGDSGSLCIDHERFGCAMVVGGTPYAEVMAQSRGATYVVDLLSIFDRLTIEPA